MRRKIKRSRKRLEESICKKPLQKSKKPKVVKSEDACKLCNFEYGDAADPFIEDEWKSCIGGIILAARPSDGVLVNNLIAMLARKINS